MWQYFVIGHGWLLISLLLIIGKQIMRTQPTMYAFFGIGTWLYSGMYNVLVLAVFAVAVWCFYLYFKRK